MNNSKTRTIIIAIVIALIGIMLACGPSSLLSRNEPTATPTKTPKPTFTITPTPTDTPIPTATPTFTPPATNTPLPTNTPVILTATPTTPPTATPTPLPTATNTPRPKPKPTKPKPKPTATKKPQPTTPPKKPWSGAVDFTLQNCGLTRIFGFTLAKGGGGDWGLAGDIWIHYWWPGDSGVWTKSGWTDFGAGTSWKGDEGNWTADLDTYAKPGTWYVCVAPSEGDVNCISDPITVTTDDNCETGIQVVHITFRKN